jgi:hypothetical protein
MRTATIDHQDDAFHVAVHENGRVVALRSGSYREVIRYATGQGVPRGRVTLTPQAQEAALATCFGGTA